MEFASEFLLLFVGVSSLLFYFTWVVPKKISRPPGPPNWPIIGSLFYLSNLPHRSLEELAKKYGPIMYLRLGFFDHIVVSNAKMAMEVLKVLDADFASRPPIIVGKYSSFDWSNIGLASYGDHFRLLRKICATQLFTQARLNNFGPGRKEEMAYMVENIAKHSHGGKLVEIRPIFHQLTSNIICRMLFGTRREKSNDLLGNDFDNFFQSNMEMLKIMNKLNISDLIPILKWFDLQGIERNMKHESNQIKKFLSKILKEYRKGNKVLANSTSTDFVEILLSLDERLDDKSIMGVLTVCEYQCTIFVLVRKYKLHFFCPLMLCLLFFLGLQNVCYFFIIGCHCNRNGNIFKHLGVGIK
jgi:hypothetical protein